MLCHILAVWFSVPLFLHLVNGNINWACLTRLQWWLNYDVPVKCSEQFLAHSNLIIVDLFLFACFHHLSLTMASWEKALSLGCSTDGGEVTGRGVGVGRVPYPCAPLPASQKPPACSVVQLGGLHARLPALPSLLWYLPDFIPPRLSGGRVITSLWLWISVLCDPRAGRAVLSCTLHF